MPFGSGLPRIHPVRLASGKPQLALRAQTIGLLILSFAYRLLYSSTITSGHIPLAWEPFLNTPLAGVVERLLILSFTYRL